MESAKYAHMNSQRIQTERADHSRTDQTLKKPIYEPINLYRMDRLCLEPNPRLLAGIPRL